MAINRKGMRKIVVDDEIYYYKITRETSFYSPYLRLVIERPDGEVVVCTLKANNEDGSERAVTPKEIVELIRLGRWREETVDASYDGIGKALASTVPEIDLEKFGKTISRPILWGFKDDEI